MPVHLTAEQLAEIQKKIYQAEINIQDLKVAVGSLAGHIVRHITVNFEKDFNGNAVTNPLSTHPNNPTQNRNVYDGLTFTALPRRVVSPIAPPLSTLPSVYARDSFAAVGLNAQSHPNVVTPIQSGAYIAFDDALSVIQVTFDPKLWIRYVTIDTALIPNPDAPLLLGKPYLEVYDKSTPPRLLATTYFQGSETPGVWQTLPMIGPTSVDIGSIQFGCQYNVNGIAQAMFDNLYYSSIAPGLNF